MTAGRMTAGRIAAGPTPLERVRRARRLLAAAVVAAAGLWAAAAGAAAMVLLALVGAGHLLPTGAAAFSGLVVAGAAGGAGAAVLWRERAVWSVDRVALWLEEHAPQLKYALLTVVEPRFAAYAAAPAAGGADTEGRTRLVAAVDQADLEQIARRSAGRLLAWAAGAVLLSGAAASLLHASGLGTLAGAGGRAARPPKVLGNRLAKLRAEIVPPAYSGLPRRVVDDPTAISSLYGTTIRVLGDGPPDGLVGIVPRDTMHRDTVSAVAVGAGWAVPVPMPKLAGVLRLEDRQEDRTRYRRLLSLEPVADSAPQLVLRAPAKDTTWRWDQPPKGELTLEADIEDDYGIRDAFFEILLSTGSAETFKTIDRSTPRVAFGGQRRATLRATVRYRDLQISQGTVLHIRAIAYDNNNVADSAGRGVSETRTLRMATKEEYDSVNVPPAAPLPIDSLFVSQRYLNMLTDTLTRVKRKFLADSQYQDTSFTYSTKQQDIRQRVEKVIAIVEDDGVGGRIETDLSRLLRQATAKMYDAYIYLAMARPDSAYAPPQSPMKEALRLLDEARKAQKYYLRGVLQTRPVNIALARLQAKEADAKAADRSARGVPEDVRRELRQRLAVAVPVVLRALEAARPEEALEPLFELKSAAVRGGAAAVAAALQEAIDQAHRGTLAQGQPAQGKPTAAALAGALAGALARARRLVEPPIQTTTGPVEWGGGMLP